MKLPTRINKISPAYDLEVGVYPPSGFLQFDEANLGNGDYFGLYWEFGKEMQEPVVCEMIHDEGRIVPCFSSLDKFLEWYELNDFDWGEKEIVDQDFVYHYINKGNDYLKQNKPEQAIEKYKKSVQSLGEISENWFKLATQQKRIGNEVDFQQSILNAILSNWAIEFPSQNAIRLFKGLKPVSELNDHPLIRNREKLEFSFGGKKENNDYRVLRDIIDELGEREDFRSTLLLEQNYATMMYWETSAFQERYGFHLEEWKAKFKSDTEERLNRKLV
ncbi:tetratricopeptide repeat-containing protein [Rapidithrix thailandica]|uniref:Tetratricopeptide repeat-containing protein n=1 Tax=Rapidithrix thailandica TaxID=413964 RepID=A0AAW9S9H5_9BACT